MATIVKGKTACPECGNEQEVKHDGRKYFISCTECRTFTSYQSKAAKARIEQRLKPLDPLPEPTETLEESEPAPKKLTPTPVRVSGGFLDSFSDLF